MKPIRFSLVHNKKRKLNKHGEAVIQLVAYKPNSKRNTKHKYISTEIYVSPEQWDSSNNRVINHELEARYNIRLLKLMQQYQEKAMTIMNRLGRCELEDLERDAGSNYNSFYEFVEAEIEISKRTKAKSTIVTYNTTLTHLKEYKSQLYFSDLTFRTIEGFEGYLAMKSVGATSRAKNHKNIKYFINQALRKDVTLPNGNPYLKFKVKHGQAKPRTYLTMEEVEKLENLQFKPEEMYLEIYRDAFLFSCWTALRNESNKVLTLSMFDKKDGEYYLRTKSKKTSKYISVPISKLFKDDTGVSKPNSMILRYEKLLKDLYGQQYRSKPIFGNVTNQASNKQLKIIGKRAVLSKVLTTHVGRHTFGTYMANRIPHHILQALMQHSKISTTMKYVHLNEKMISEGLDNVNW